MIHGLVRRRRRRLLVIAAALAPAVLLGALALVVQGPSLLWNRSESEPRGLYIRSAAAPSRGQIIAFLYLINGIFGVGVGSVSIALATDYLFVESGVRMSLLVLPPITMTLAFGLAMLGWRGYQRARMDMAG